VGSPKRTIHQNLHPLEPCRSCRSCCHPWSPSPAPDWGQSPLRMWAALPRAGSDGNGQTRCRCALQARFPRASR
jgi:hypothetical protein